jgi:hypothetical protein
MSIIINNNINNYIQEQQERNLYNDLERKLRNAEYARKHYYNNRERLIKEKSEYNKHYEKYNDNCKLYTRTRYYINKGYFDGIERNEAIEITKYLINNHLSIKYINYVKEWIEMSNINYRL